MSKTTAEDRAIAKWRKVKLNSGNLNKELFASARKGWANAVQELLVMGGNANAQAGGQSILAWACKWGTDDVGTARVLLAANADPNGPSVMETCGVATLPTLIVAGGKLNGEKSGVSPLLSAIVARTKEDKALALIEAGANVNVRDKDGVTPLMLAAERGRLQVFDALMEAGADVFAVDNSGRSILRRAAETAVGGRLGAIDTQRKFALQILRRLRDHLPAQPEDTILIDIVLGNVKELESKLAAGLDPNMAIEGGVGQLGLFRADYIEHLTGHGSIDKAFQRGVLPSRKELDRRIGGSSLLMWAVAARKLSVIKLLIDAGADPDSTNDAGLSPRALAQEWGDAKTRAIFNS